MSYKLLKNHVKKRLENELRQTYGFKVFNDWIFYELGNNRIWLLTPKLSNFNTKSLNVETMGLYFCYFDKKRMRLSPEAAQLVGASASKNVINISLKQAEQLIRGFDIEKNTDSDAEYVILNTPKGIIGVGKNHKTKILCQFRKNRRIRAL